MIFITNNIKLLRTYKNVSQKQMSDDIGIAQQTLSRIENGGSGNISTTRKIANYFGVGIDDLYSDNIFLDKNTIINCKKSK